MSGAAQDHPIERLSAYLDDELPVDERSELDRHLAACGSCREHLEVLRLLARAVRDEPVPGIPDGLMERITRGIDAATVVPLRRRRFVVPATIAATIGAIGLIAVVTFRQGGPPRPVVREPRLESPATIRDESSQGAARRDAAPEELKASAPAEPARSAEAAREKSKGANAVEGGVMGGVVGGVVGGVQGGVEADALRKDEAGPRTQAALDEADKRVAAPTPAPVMAQAPQIAPDAPAGGNAPLVLCGDQWLDAGVEATWDTADRVVAIAELERLARAHGGRVDLPGPGAPGLAFVILPRARYAEFAAAASAAGIRGLEGLVPPETAGCVRQRVTLRPEPER